MVLSVETPQGDLVFVPENLNDPKLVWRCIPARASSARRCRAACR
jgi:hypothetical protein